MNKEIRPLPQPTLKMIDPVEGSKEFRDVFRPMYGSLSMGAYELILSGERPKKRGDNRYIDQKKYFVKENGETPKWERLARRLDRNFYAFLYPHINHNGMEKQESPDNEVQKKIIKDIISALPLGKDTVAELKRKLDLDESQFSKEKLIAASAHFSMLLREGNTLNPFINKNLFPTHGNLLENRNEITVPSNRPSKMLRRATGNDIHPRLQHEGRLQGLLTLAAAELYADKRNLSLTNHLSDMQDVLDTHFFDGLIGETTIQTTYVIHDNKTNRPIGIDGRFLPINFPSLSPDSYHVKKHIYQVRKIKNMENQASKSGVDQKEWASSLAKVLRRAIENKKTKGIDKIDQNVVRDMSRKRLVVQDSYTPDDSLLEEVMEKLTESLRHQGEIEYTQRRDSSQTNKNQIESLPYKRIYIKYQDVPTETEIMVYDEITYLIGKYDIGKEELTKKNIDKQLGLAESLFGIHRQIKLISTIMPKEIPGFEDDLEQSGIDSYNDERQRLSNARRADEETSKMILERSYFPR